MKLVISIFLVFFLTSCATRFHNPNIPLSDESLYFEAIEKQTRKKQVYDGFHATLEFSATLLNSTVTKYQVDQLARIYQWTSEKYADEKAKSESQLSKQTEVFLSFYVPDKKNDDLHKTKTLWKVFLDSNGRRFEGKVEKIKTQLAEVSAIYPHYNRWSTPYRVIFAIPVSQIESYPSKLTLTGPVGSAAVEFAN
jgi:hypothetical protein